MELHLLLDKLRENKCAPQCFGCLNQSRDLLCVRMLEQKQSAFEPSTLYLTDPDSLPDPSMPEDFAVFCCGNAIDFSAYENSAFTVVYFGNDISCERLFNLTMEHLTELQQITVGMHLLVNAVFSGNGLQYLIDTATHIFGNPIYVVDLQNKYLAMPEGLIPDSEFFREESRSGYISASGIASIRANRLDEKVRRSGTAYYYVNDLVGKGMLVDAVKIQGIEVAHIMMLESEQQFHEYDPDFFHRFSNLVSLELQKDSAYTRNKGMMYSYFLADLLRNSNVSNIRQRLEDLGVHLKETFYIIAIPPAGVGLSNLRQEIILERVKQILPESIYVIYEETIVLLISQDLDQNLNKYEIARLDEYLSANHLKAGISNFFQYLEDTARFYRQAVDSVRIANRLNVPDAICYYSDYYVYRMLETFEKEDTEIRFLIHPGLMKLYLYDQKRETELISTLREYLIHPGQSSLVAENLHIHKNTLLYRLGKIREITGCSLSDGEEFMNLNLSLMIMNYLGMLA